MNEARPLRRWHPWRRRIYTWVMRLADCWLKPPPEPRMYRVDSTEREHELKMRLMRGVVRDG